MKVLLITSLKITGLNYHRQIVPFTSLDIDAVAYPIWDYEWSDEFLKEFQFVSFLRSIDLFGRTTEIVERCHKLGIKIHFDIDDYWVLPVHHPLRPNFIKNNVTNQVIEALKLSDVITTSTAHLAKVIQQHNTNVYVLPNAINPNEEQWQRVEIKNDLLRFGYIAGVHHVQDVELLKPNFDKLWTDKYCEGKFQLAPAGFNLNDRDGVKEMNVYYNYVEHIFTNFYYHLKDKDYVEYLKCQNPEDNHLTYDKPYRRLWGMDTYNYAKLYNLIDVSLVPLVPNLFSACKSELKLIEAGFMKKAVMVSNVKPYSDLANKNNSILITNEKDWFKGMKSLIADRQKVIDLGEAMYETVKDKYHIETVNKERKQIFDKLCK